VWGGSFTPKCPTLCENQKTSLYIYVIVQWQSAKVIARCKIKLTLSKVFSSVLCLRFFLYICFCILKFKEQKTFCRQVFIRMVGVISVGSYLIHFSEITLHLCCSNEQKLVPDVHAKK